MSEWLQGDDDTGANEGLRRAEHVIDMSTPTSRRATGRLSHIEPRHVPQRLLDFGMVLLAFLFLYAIRLFLVYI